jgi:LruC domain-containing protein
MTDLGYAPFNPFIFSNAQRGLEIHLPDKPPPAKANKALFGQEQDNSQPHNGLYYKTENHLPWAISIPERFDYPVEYSPVQEVYLHFRAWAESGGLAYPDWFRKNNGYRKAGYIIQRYNEFLRRDQLLPVHLNQ